MNNYYNERNKKNLEKLRAIRTELPPWFSVFIRDIESTTEVLTRLNYAYDTRVFLRFLNQEIRSVAGVPIEQITCEMLDDLTLNDLKIYVDYLGYYFKTRITTDGSNEVTEVQDEIENAERGKARKIASLRTLFKYLYKNERIKDNPADLLDMPKLHERTILRLDSDEIDRLINVIRSGEGLTEHQAIYNAQTSVRDLAIITLFLTTGIRVSELVGLNVGSIDLENDTFIITRKGGNQAILYFGSEAHDALDDYLSERRQNPDTMPQNDSPLFLSLQKKRVSVRTVENLVKKYAKVVSPLKNISPHKLRSTYGTMLYNETGDIYLVADVLGHKDVNTTRKHYATVLEDRRRLAASVIKLDKDSHDPDK